MPGLAAKWSQVVIWSAILAGGGAMAQEDARPPAETGRNSAARRDFHSFGNPDQVRIRHLTLDLAVDFDRKALSGTALLRFDRQAGADPKAPLLLDSRDLIIDEVSAASGEEDWKPAGFKLGNPDPILGRSIAIELPEKADRVRIRYRTSPGSTALQWVDPPQTAGGKKPFLFSQSQAIHARSWIPLQDSPGVRITYDATIRVPGREDVAVMAADRLGAEGGAFRFRMPQAIPSYLIALAVGDLASAPIGPRSKVWAEPSVVAPAAFEFADTGKMIETVEKRYGPYRWGDYDVLVLPPSFPFGGMENPKLTFATPTVLAGDRSLVGLIAHELAHSWSGNLVTNATWRDFWLNEGFTTYLERRIVEDVFGADRAAMEWVLARRELQDELNRLGPRDQVLHADLKGRDPDDAMNAVAYEKGALFLATLEKIYGRDAFDAFLKGYFDHFAFRSIATSDLEAYLREHLFEKGKVEPISIHAWIHEPGLPPDAPTFRSARFEAVDRQARDWLDGRIKAADLKTADWSTFEWLRLLDALPQKLPVARLAELDAALSLTGRKNAEIVQPWLLLGLRSGYAPADRRAEEFLSTIGRRKYVLPLFKEYARTAAGRDRARGIFEKVRSRYHPITADSVEKALAKPDR